MHLCDMVNLITAFGQSKVQPQDSLSISQTQNPPLVSLTTLLYVCMALTSHLALSTTLMGPNFTFHQNIQPFSFSLDLHPLYYFHGVGSATNLILLILKDMYTFIMSGMTTQKTWLRKKKWAHRLH